MRLRISKQLEKSTTIGSLIVTDSSNEAKYLPPANNGDLLNLVAGVPTYTAALTALKISYGEYEITGVANQLSYTIPFVTTINHVQITQIKNSLGDGYYSDYIVEVSAGVGVNILYDVQPPIGEKIKFNYLIFG